VIGLDEAKAEFAETWRAGLARVTQGAPVSRSGLAGDTIRRINGARRAVGVDAPVLSQPAA
jgi:hypothetical protein